MAAVVAELMARLRAENSQFLRGMRDAERAIQGFDARVSHAGGGLMSLQRQVQSMAAGITSAVSQAAGAIGIIGTSAAASLGAVGFSYNTLLQRTTAGFTTLLNSGEKAKGLIQELTIFARTSPFPRQVFIEAAQQLLGFGISAQKIVPIFQTIQDTVAAMGRGTEDIFQITSIFSRIKSTGKATSEELMRFALVGVDAFKMLAEQSGKSVQQIRDEVSDGKLDADTTIDLLVKGLNDKFAGGAAKVKDTWIGAIDRIKGAWRDIGSKLLAPIINPQGGGAGVVWANRIADGLRYLEKHVVGRVGNSLMKFFRELGERLEEIQFDKWIERAKNLWQEFGGYVKEFMPVILAVTAAFAKLGVNRLPFGNQFAGLIPILGPINMALLALIASNDELRAKFMSMAQGVKDAVLPALEQLGKAAASAVGMVAAVLTSIGPGVIVQLSQSFAQLLGVLADLMPIFGKIASGGLVIFLTVLPPLVQMLANVARWVANVVEVLGPFGTVVAAAGISWLVFRNRLATMTGVIPSILKAFGSLYTFLAAHPFIQLGLAILVFTALAIGSFERIGNAVEDVREGVSTTMQILGAVFSGARATLAHHIGELPRIISNALQPVIDTVVRVGNAFTALPGVVRGAFQAIWRDIVRVGRAIRMAIRDALDPFQRHSPSLVDQVIAGTQTIATKYAGLANNLIPRLRSMEAAMQRLGAASAAPMIQLETKGLNEVAEQIKLFGGSGLLAAYNQMTAEIQALNREMEPLLEKYRAENEILVEKQKRLTELEKAYQQVGHAQSEIQRILNTPLVGTDKFDDASYAMERSIMELQRQLQELLISGAPEAQIRGIQEQIDRLQKAAEKIRLDKALTIGDQEHQLQELADTTEEITFEDAVKGIKDSLKAIEDLTSAMLPAQDGLDGIANSGTVYQQWERAIENATQDVELQTSAVDELGQAIGGMQSIAEAYGRAQEEIAQKAAQHWADVMKAMNGEPVDPGFIDTPVAPYDPPALEEQATGGIFDGLKERVALDFAEIEATVKNFSTKFVLLMTDAAMAVAGIFALRAAPGIITALQGLGMTAGATFAGAFASTVGAVMVGAGIGKLLGDWWVSNQRDKGAGRAADFLSGLPDPKQLDGRIDRVRILREKLEELAAEHGIAKGEIPGWGDVLNSSNPVFTLWERGFGDASAEAIALKEEIEAIVGAAQLTEDEIARLSLEANGALQTWTAMGGIEGPKFETFDGFVELGAALLDSGVQVEDLQKKFDEIVPHMVALGIDGTEAAWMYANGIGPAFEHAIEVSKRLAEKSNENFKKATSIFDILSKDPNASADDVKAIFDKLKSDTDKWADAMEQLAAEGPGKGVTAELLMALHDAGPEGYELALKALGMARDGTLKGLADMTPSIKVGYDKVKALAQNAVGYETAGRGNMLAYWQGLLAVVTDPTRRQQVLNEIARLGIDMANMLHNTIIWKLVADYGFTMGPNGTLVPPAGMHPGDLAATAATGGFVSGVYMANGGLGPRGTDTIPAWLTPGEFVLQKSAVDRLGTDFLYALNSGLTLSDLMGQSVIGRGGIRMADGGAVGRSQSGAVSRDGGSGNTYVFVNKGVIGSRSELDRWVQDSIARAERRGIRRS